MNENLGPGPVNTNLGPGSVNTNWGAGPVNTNWGQGPGGGETRAGGQAEDWGPGNTNTRIKQTFAVLNMSSIFTFHISHFTNHLRHVMFMLNSNEPIKVAHLQKLASQSILHGAIVTEMVNKSFSES